MREGVSHPAIPALVDALIGDVFYQTILVAHDGDEAKRAALARYMAYSIGEAERTGRVVVDGEPPIGAALWLLPRTPDVEGREHAAKHAFLADLCGPVGYERYRRIVGFMHARAEQAIAADAWYLSILGVDPAAQGRGIGAGLLAPTLAEADAAGAATWLETFTTRGARFYERVGYTLVAWHDEPTTGRAYAVLQREP
ncbi:MAG: GNAT family N-acetyltransferase [Vicinamibacteraceae bacterium]